MITLIAAIDQSKGLGYKQKLLCHLQEDLKRFKKATANSICIQGRKTYQSIVNQLGHALPNRTNIVLTNNKKFTPADIETHVYHSVDDIMHEYEDYGEGEADVFVIGGSSCYKEFYDKADRMLLSIIQHKFDKVDTYFPDFDEKDWDKRQVGYKAADEYNDYAVYFMEYTRKQSNQLYKIN